ncbi:Type II secretion system F domain-containing protein [Operophtera brumata]|uniref:Type II secretion system F domain-containing protein n=1 Tax=Operophtera brumata TaxID=104452 RepID=A0A0L7KQM6_OPEBR|nr:Type II secretion system F domain-containing protein [Operophtera brumata]
MSLQKNRPPTSKLQRILNSFKQFERKLDKLQNDLSYHGQSLNTLRSLVVNLSARTVSNPDVQQEPVKRVLKNTAVQSEPQAEEHVTVKPKRRHSIRPLPTKAKKLINQTVFEMPYSTKQPNKNRVLKQKLRNEKIYRGQQKSRKAPPKLS